MVELPLLNYYEAAMTFDYKSNILKFFSKILPFSACVCEVAVLRRYCCEIAKLSVEPSRFFLLSNCFTVNRRVLKLEKLKRNLSFFRKT